MTDMNQPNGSRSSGMFAHDVATDLASGRAVELAELYALDAVSGVERAAIDEYISAAPGPERDAFDERVRQARETLAVTFTAEEEPPAGLFNRIVAQLPAQSGVQQSGAGPNRSCAVRAGPAGNAGRRSSGGR